MANGYGTVVLPTIDEISNDSFAYTQQLHAKGTASRCIFNFRFQYKAMKSIAHIVYPSKPFESPVMDGNAFAIRKGFFEERGAYDTGLDAYGKCESSVRITFQFNLIEMDLIDRWRTV